MTTIYLVFAIVGGVFMLCQFAMTLLGLSGEHEFAGDHHVELGGHDGGGHEHGDQASTWFFHVLSLRALVAAVTFFGLGGLAASSSVLLQGVSLLVALSLGAVAMIGVAWLMGVLHGLQSEGTVYIEQALGAMGTVYLTVPPANGGQGKVTVKVRNRTMEYSAVTAESEPLKTGSPVVVVGIEGTGVVQVKHAEG